MNISHKLSATITQHHQKLAPDSSPILELFNLHFHFLMILLLPFWSIFSCVSVQFFTVSSVLVCVCSVLVCVCMWCVQCVYVVCHCVQCVQYVQCVIMCVFSLSMCLQCMWCQLFQFRLGLCRFPPLTMTEDKTFH